MQRLNGIPIAVESRARVNLTLMQQPSRGQCSRNMDPGDGAQLINTWAIVHVQYAESRFRIPALPPCFGRGGGQPKSQKNPSPMNMAKAFFIMMEASIAFSQNTAASSVWASDKAHSLRYDAVFETIPSTNSIISIACEHPPPHKHTNTCKRRRVLRVLLSTCEPKLLLSRKHHLSGKRRVQRSATRRPQRPNRVVPNYQRHCHNASCK